MQFFVNIGLIYRKTAENVNKNNGVPSIIYKQFKAR